MKPSSRTKQLTVRINEQDRRRLHLAAADLKITVTDMVKTALTATYGVELNG
jgi:predicted HicB family RNase H-like nuclease